MKELVKCFGTGMVMISVVAAFFGVVGAAQYALKHFRYGPAVVIGLLMVLVATGLGWCWRTSE